MRRIQDATRFNKLTPKWGGPLRVTQVLRPGVVHLETEDDGKEVPNSWNIEHLKKYHLQKLYP
jgi:hypothetical protein